MSKKGLQAYGKMKAVKNRNSRMQEAMRKSGIGGAKGVMTENEINKMMEMKITPQKKYNFLNSGGAKGTMTEEELKMLKNRNR